MAKAAESRKYREKVKILLGALKENLRKAGRGQTQEQGEK